MWGEEDADDNKQVYDDMQLKLELRDRVDNLFKFLHKAIPTQVRDYSTSSTEVLGKNDVPGWSTILLQWGDFSRVASEDLALDRQNLVLLTKMSFGFCHRGINGLERSLLLDCSQNDESSAPNRIEVVSYQANPKTNRMLQMRTNINRAEQSEPQAEDHRDSPAQEARSVDGRTSDSSWYHESTSRAKKAVRVADFAEGADADEARSEGS
ncbi:hypothetical protein LWI29_014177 [Acer saccharum]|uniref:Uncharacterized protein n=1 Tax=Acer saccharum TaxID=4024 RepID=A0AA39SE88_ACESA|nr:hypothetical protein LWI29_014177 [Acer saccharum]